MALESAFGWSAGTVVDVFTEGERAGEPCGIAAGPTGCSVSCKVKCVCGTTKLSRRRFRKGVELERDGRVVLPLETPRMLRSSSLSRRGHGSRSRTRSSRTCRRTQCVRQILNGRDEIGKRPSLCVLVGCTGGFVFLRGGDEVAERGVVVRRQAAVGASRHGLLVRKKRRLHTW